MIDFLSILLCASKLAFLALLSLVFTSDITIRTYARAVSTSWFVNSFVLGKYKEFNILCTWEVQITISFVLGKYRVQFPLYLESTKSSISFALGKYRVQFPLYLESTESSINHEVLSARAYVVVLMLMSLARTRL